MSENKGSGEAFEKFKEAHDFRIQLNEKSKVNKTIGIISGKGGVGKSFVTAALASEMQRRNHRTAVLDGDITGPSMGKVFGVHEKASGMDNLIYPAETKSGIQLITANMLLEKDDQPIIWRGPMVAGVLKQFYSEVYWNDVDFMFVDMPPGTGDIPLTLFQSVPLDGIVVVTTPQDLVAMVVEKAINMANMMNIKVLGLIENMSYVECDKCGNRMEVFGKSHLPEVSEKYHLPVLAQIPLRPEHAEACDNGTIEDLKVKELDSACDVIEKL
ncbi:MAG: Mrp/NBP35 family ATP-binding protein [Solobacterium sp.]|jgi:Mrp family chromosome partitioning ATPase|nr:Mrp/NBP35 family ATP-binding protein [Solobacterium sp.]MCH4222692.1 Mrp/NBP35 family ATP-binding protein [Solobacterium sp.]MCH4265274.1 Mrp/NBP35 family ATP-binding protein [Solobacterium sp.]